jgi:hypothetical protein
MRSSTLGGITAVLGSLISACAPPASSTTTVPPPFPTPVPDTGGTTGIRHLAISPGRFHYRVIQNTTIETHGVPDTTGGITTTAHLSVDVSPGSDSSYRVIVSVDSVQLITQGAIPGRGVGQVSSLGPVLRASIGTHYAVAEAVLADSLCAYSQLVTAARDLLLPQLPLQISTRVPERWVDSATVVSCRAGTQIHMRMVRELTNLRTDPPTLTLQGTTDLAGSGALREGPVKVSGAIMTRGRISFTRGSRLPSLVETESEGSIIVQLKDSATVFRQKTTQQIQQVEDSRLPN